MHLLLVPALNGGHVDGKSRSKQQTGLGVDDIRLAAVPCCQVRILDIVGEVNLKRPKCGLDGSVVIVSCSPPFFTVFPLSLHVVLGV